MALYIPSKYEKESALVANSGKLLQIRGDPLKIGRARTRALTLSVNPCQLLSLFLGDMIRYAHKVIPNISPR